MRKPLLLLALISLLAYTACGGGDPSIPNLPNVGGGDNGGGGGDTIPLNSTVKGKISFEGTAPAPKKIQTTADPGCKNSDLTDEQLLVSDGGLENVIIYVSSNLAGMKLPARKETVTLDQKGCHYVPHALTLQTGQEFVIKNSDDTAHNVHTHSMINASFNESQPRVGATKSVKFEQEEIHFPIRCDIHNWMNAFVGVFKHPLHTVSGKGGAFELKLPTGTFEITAVHENEKFAPQKQMVEVADGATVDLNFTFKGL